MLVEAIQAGIPILVATTGDTLNVESVLSEALRAPEGGDSLSVVRWTGSNHVKASETVLYCVGEPPGAVDAKLYVHLSNIDSVLVLINPPETPPEAFVVGEVPIPPSMIESLLASVVGKDAHKFTRALSGLNLKQAGEVIRLTQSIHGHLSVRGVAAIRSRLAGTMQGILPVDTGMALFVPDPRLKAWVLQSKPFFTEIEIQALIPRGVLLHGSPGTGKTASSKYLAESFGVPLFRLDLSSSLGRYVGESESNLARALNLIDQEAPCVLLIDEAEKLFTHKEDSGVTSRLLAQLLWWLQEHRSRVFTVITTNDLDALPPELYRPGRIDETFNIAPLDHMDAVDLAMMEVVRLLPKADKHKARVTLMARLQEKAYVHAEAIKAGRNLARELLTISKH